MWWEWSFLQRRGSGFGGFCGVLAGEDGETEWPSKYS